jgi:asparagine synthase (glutamine-hydrolysing)
MCGIAGIVLKQATDPDLVEKIISMSSALTHRGPDGEGFMIAAEKGMTPHFHLQKQDYARRDLNYIPRSDIRTGEPNAFLAFGHRRLSIIDLSEAGHQPMCNTSGKTWIVYNGEIYNYIELRDQLKKAGHAFISQCDTEVILHAYKEWGFDCVQHFNGMWAFCIYDSEKQICFASRDRFGVKPFYYVNTPQSFSFASEQKAFVRAGIIAAKINGKALHHYLVNGLLENNTHNFFDGVEELWPGNNLIYDLRTKEINAAKYFHLGDSITLSNEAPDEKNLIEKISVTLENAVKLRLRSDVEVGTCLSGGIDSSALAILIAKHTVNPLNCFTSVFRGRSFNEELYADIVAAKIHGKHYKIEPTLEGFLKEADELIYSQDVPIWDTSTYAQYKVMELAKVHGIKVVLDGQGADELFGGYHHHFTAKWNNLLAHGKFIGALKDMKTSAKTIANPFAFYLKERLKQKYNFNQKHFSFFFKESFVKSHSVINPQSYFADVNSQLTNDIYETRLKSFLKCEDRCGMWHSVESRTPFSDDPDLINLMFSFNGNKKIQNGISKYLLREAVKKKLPPEIYSRYDKKGFETPMQDWMRQVRPRLLSEIKSASFEFVDYKKIDATNENNTFQNKLLFKLFVLSRWKKVFK